MSRWRHQGSDCIRKPAALIRGSIIVMALIMSAPALAAGDSWTFLLGLTNFRHAMNTDETPFGSLGNQTREYTFANLSLGYNFGNFSLGVRYLAGTVLTETSLQGEQNKTIEEDGLNVWGIMAGYINEHLTIQLALVPFGAKDHKLTTIGQSGVNSVRTARYGATTGEIIDIGYSFEARGLKVGPLLSFATLKYGSKAQDGTSTKLKSQMGDDFVMPSFCLRIDF